VRSAKHFKSTYLQHAKDGGHDLTYTSADLSPLTVSPFRGRLISNPRLDSNFDSSPSSFAFSPLNFKAKKFNDPYAMGDDIDKSNFQSELSLGVHHPS
jgi:hypothetical protein